MAGGGDVAQLAGLNRLAHVLRLDETPEFPDNHHLAGTKPRYQSAAAPDACGRWARGDGAAGETLAMPPGGVMRPMPPRER